MTSRRTLTYISQLACAVIGKASFLVVAILLYKALSMADAAAFALCYATATVLATISECGMRGLMVREMSRLNEDPAAATLLLSGTLNARLWSLLPYLAAGAVAGLAAVPEGHYLSLSLLLASVWLDSNSQVIRGALRAYDHIIMDAAVGTVSRVVLLFLSLYLYLDNRLSLEVFAGSWAVISACDLFLSLLVVKTTTRLKVSLCSTTRYTVDLIKRAAPFTLLAILSITYLRVGTLILGSSKAPGFLGETAGFSLAGRIPEGVTFLPIAFMNASIPYISRNSKDLKLLTPLFQSLERIIGAAGILIGVALIAFPEQLILLLSKPDYLGFATVFQVYGVVLFFSFTQYIYSNLLLSMDQERKVAARHAYVLVANILLNLVLIRKFGALGAVMALLLCEAASVGIDLYYLRGTKAVASAKILTFWAILAVVSISSAYLIKELNPRMGLWIYLLFAGMAGLIVLVATEKRSIIKLGRPSR